MISNIEFSIDRKDLMSATNSLKNKIKQAARFPGNTNLNLTVFEGQEILNFLEEMTVELKEIDQILRRQKNDLGYFLKQIRTAVADYMSSEGCSCCRDIDSHRMHEKILVKLLRVQKYKDGSGYNFNKYRTEKKENK